MMTGKFKMLTALVLTFTLGLGGVALLQRSEAAPNVAPSPGAAKPADLNKLWKDLASSDEAIVARALLRLSATPDQTVAFIKEQLPPVKADADSVNKLVKDLDSDEFKVREQAFARLEYLGKYAKPHLEKVLAGKPSAEVKKRIEQLIAQLPGDPNAAAPPANPIAPGQPVRVQVQIINGRVIQKINGVPVNNNPVAARKGPSDKWLRAARAVALLEHLNTKEARAHLEALAAGEAQALPTKEAKGALDRLK